VEWPRSWRLHVQDLLVQEALGAFVLGVLEEGLAGAYFDDDLTGLRRLIPSLRAVSLLETSLPTDSTIYCARVYGIGFDAPMMPAGAISPQEAVLGDDHRHAATMEVGHCIENLDDHLRVQRSSASSETFLSFTGGA
jgi:hypothetical protein